MTTDRLRKIAEREAREHLRDFWRVNLVECYGDILTDVEIDEVLRMIREDVHIPAPPRIIRTREELAALDGMTYEYGDNGWDGENSSPMHWPVEPSCRDDDHVCPEPAPPRYRRLVGPWEEA